MALPGAASSLRLILLALLTSLALSASERAAAVQNFIYTSADDLKSIEATIRRPDIQGVQIVYTWKALEKDKGQYDFSRIERDLVYLNGLNRKLFIQIQARFFEPDARNIPAYLLREPIYQGGLVPQYDNPGENRPIGNGWVAQQWNPAVAERYRQLLVALAKEFDGRVLGINLPETAIDIDMKRDRTGLVAMAVQEPTLTYTNPSTHKPFTRDEFTQYAEDYPGADIIFWSADSPWLRNGEVSANFF